MIQRISSHKKFWRRRGDFAAIAALALLALLFMLPYWLTQNTVVYPASNLGSDIFINRWHKLALIQDSLLNEGRLPLWNPYHFGGQPIFGSPTSLLPYPPLLLLLLILPIPAALMTLTTLHLFISGAGMYGWLRQGYGFARWIALLGAVSFMFMPKLIAHLAAGHVDVYAALVWMPWVSWGVHTAVQSGRWSALPATGLVVGMQLICHGQFAFYTAALAAVYGIILALPNLRRTARFLLQMALLTAFAALCAAGQLIPMLELMPHASRTALDPLTTNSGALPFPLLFTLLSPSDFLFPEWILYPGILSVLIAPLALRQPNRLVWFWLIGIGFSLIYALGQTGGLFPIIQQFVPGFGLFRVPPRLLILLNLGAPVLLAFALQSLSTHSPPRYWRRAAGLVAFGMTAVIIYSLTRGTALPVNVSLSLLLLPLVLLLPRALQHSRWRWLALFILLLDAMRFDWAQTSVISIDESLAQPPALHAITTDGRLFFPFGGVAPSAPFQVGIKTLNGVDPFQFGYNTRAINLAAGCPRWGIAAEVPTCHETSGDLLLNLIAAYNVTHVVIPAWLEQPLQPTTRIGDLSLYRVENPLPRAYIVWQAEAEPTDLATVDFAQTALVENSTLRDRLRAADPAQPIPVVTIVSSSRESLELTATLTQPGLLVIADTWAPGWRAFVNGISAPVERVNLSQRGILLEAGSQSITVNYQPQGDPWALWISAASSLIALLLLFWRKF